MKKVLFISCLLSAAINSFAISFQDQLEARNQQWKQHRTLLFAGEAKLFSDDRAFLQAHFAGVEMVLRSANVTALTPKQLEARKRNIELLHDYAMRGIFPHNSYSYARPVFVDEFNTHCAVGHLMQMSGNDALAMRISSRNNYVYAMDIDDPEIYAWQEASGLTLQELALIQPTYLESAPDPVQVEPICTTAYFTDYPNSLSPEQRARLISYRGTCQNGVLDGIWEQYYSPEQIWIRGNYSNGKKNGEWQYYSKSHFEPSYLERSEQWVNGQLHGTYLAYDSTGRKSTEGLYINGERTGRWTYWSRGHVVQTEDYVHGKLEGDKYVYNPGADTTKKEARQHVIYHEGRIITYEHFSNSGVLQDKTRYYFEGQGPLQSMVSISHQGFNVHKDSTRYTCVPPDPTLIKCYTETWSYTNDTLNGHRLVSPAGIVVYLFRYDHTKITSGLRIDTNSRTCEKWRSVSDSSLLYYEQIDSTGKLLQKGPMIDTNIRIGAWEFYDLNGRVIATGSYVNGMKEGVWMEVNSLGILTEVIYEQGERKR